MGKKLQFDLDAFDEEDTNRFMKLIEKKSDRKYGEDEMVIYGCCKDEFLDREYPGNIDSNDKSEE